MLSYKIIDLSIIKESFVGYNKIEFYYDGDKLPDVFSKEAMADLLMAFSVKDCHTMLKEAIGHNVKSMFNKELSKEDKSLILGLVNDINENVKNRSDYEPK